MIEKVIHLSAGILKTDAETINANVDAENTKDFPIQTEEQIIDEVIND